MPLQTGAHCAAAEQHLGGDSKRSDFDAQFETILNHFTSFHRKNSQDTSSQERRRRELLVGVGLRDGLLSARFEPFWRRQRWLLGSCGRSGILGPMSIDSSACLEPGQPDSSPGLGGFLLSRKGKALRRRGQRTSSSTPPKRGSRFWRRNFGTGSQRRPGFLLDPLSGTLTQAKRGKTPRRWRHSKRGIGVRLNEVEHKVNLVLLPTCWELREVKGALGYESASDAPSLWKARTGRTVPVRGVVSRVHVVVS